MPEQPAAFDLDPLLTHREDCLAPTPGTEVRDAKLRRAKIKFDTEHRSRFSYESGDLFASPQFQEALDQAAAGKAHVTEVQLDLYFPESAEPCTLRLQSPNTAEVSNKNFAVRALNWLAHSGFTKLAQAAVSKTLIILALAFVAILSSCPGLTPDDDDTPDDQEDTHSLPGH